MKIYTINHYWNNGESYEDYREYENILYYSTLDKAYNIFWEKVTSDYEGIIKLKEITLDTQEIITLEESAWINCTSIWDSYEDNYIGDYNYTYEDDYYDTYSQYYNNAEMEVLEEESYAIDEWLTHEGENFKIFEEINAIRLTNILKDLENLIAK